MCPCSLLRERASGLMLGVRMYNKFCGSVLATEGAFETKMEGLCREIGERGKA